MQKTYMHTDTHKDTYVSCQPYRRRILYVQRNTETYTVSSEQLNKSTG